MFSIGKLALIFCVPLTQAYTANVISQYFAEIRPCNKVIIIQTCKNLILLVQQLNEINISWTVATDIAAVRHDDSPSGIFIDCEKCECLQLRNAIFNASYHWLIVANRKMIESGVHTYYSRMRLDSQVMIIERNDSVGYTLFDIYRFGRSTLQCREVGRVNAYGKWTMEKFSSVYHQTYRGNLQKMAMRTAIPVNVPLDLVGWQSKIFICRSGIECWIVILRHLIEFYHHEDHHLRPYRW